MRNGRHKPARPRIEVRQAAASPEQAAAIAAAIEQFLRDTAPAASGAPARAPWARAALLESAGHGSRSPSPWGERVPWGVR